MMHTAELDMADSVYPADIDTFIDNAVWAIRSTYDTVLKASPGAAIFGRDMLFDILFVADWHKIGDYRQHQTDRSNIHENNKRVDYDYKVGDKVLIRKDGILRKADSI
jgi:hypothetical protein